MDSVSQLTNATRFVQQIVRNNCVVIFSTTTCPYCRTAKSVFKEMGVSTEIIEVNQREDGRDIMQVLRMITGLHTVPQVFINGTYVGGGMETKQLYVSGRLLQLVSECH
jgi:glutaredoxin 3